MRNYADGLTGPSVLGVSALASVWISLKFALISTLVSTPIALFAALSVYHKFRGRALLRSIYLVPYVIPGFVVALLAQIAFLNHYGAVDRLLSTLHLGSGNTFWLIGPNAFWAMTFTEIWEVWPFMYLLLLAGLQAIPRDQLEAATVDGAGWWARLRYIVLPQLKGVYALAFGLATLFHFGNFTLPYILFGNTPPLVGRRPAAQHLLRRIPWFRLRRRVGDRGLQHPAPGGSGHGLPVDRPARVPREGGPSH